MAIFSHAIAALLAISSGIPLSVSANLLLNTSKLSHPWNPSPRTTADRIAVMGRYAPC